MQLSVSFFLQAMLKSTALLAGAWVVIFVLRGKSAAVRHQAWSLALAAVLALPFFSTLLPAWRVPLAKSVLSDTLVFKTEVHAAQTTQHNPQTGAATLLSDSQRWLANNGALLAVSWALGAAASLAQMLIGWAAVERLRRGATPLDTPEFAPLIQALGIKGNVDLRKSAAGSMPITYGLIKQTILLPADALAWSENRRRAVLLHELAHVLRKDGATQLLARLTLAFYWWHPLVWAAWREFLKERERAADDVVLNLGSNAPEYAGHLLAVARSMHSPTALGWAAIAMARHSQLEGRLAAILDPRRDRKSPARSTAIAAFVCAFVVVTPWAALQAKVETGQAAAKTGDPLATDFISRGKAALAVKDYPTAINFFERAQSPNPTATAQAKMWLAITQESQGNLDAAAAFYKDALATDVPESPSAAIIMDLYSALLVRLNRDEEAKKMARQAAGIRQIQSHKVESSIHHDSDIRKIGGDVSAPKLVSKVEPEYSEDARLAKYSGTATLAVEIGVDGVPRNITVVRSLGLGLDEKAVEAVSRWRFKPGIVNGQLVPVMARIEINFRLL